MILESRHSSVSLTRNNFHLLRLVFAIMVCLYHSFELSHLAELAWIPRFFSPEIAVNGFFIISGFLITLSHDRSSGTKAFFRRRFFRIYPAYIVVVLASSIGLLAFSTEPAANYFNNSWAMYVFANVFLLDFIQPTLPGVFVKNIFHSINGSLWTIKVEVFLYATVPLVAFFSRDDLNHVSYTEPSEFAYPFATHRHPVAR